MSVEKQIDAVLKEFVPHYGHQYCNEICPNYRAKAELLRIVNEAIIDEVRNAELWIDGGIKFKSQDEYGNTIWESQDDRIATLTTTTNKASKFEITGFSNSLDIIMPDKKETAE